MNFSLIISGKDVTSQELDMAVFEFLEVERSEGRCVRNKDLQEKALETADTLALPEFQASCQWLRSWKKRWNVGFRRGTSCTQRVPADFQEQLHHFRYCVVQQRLLHNLDRYQIWNMDQTMCRFVTKNWQLRYELNTPCHGFSPCLQIRSSP